MPDLTPAQRAVLRLLESGDGQQFDGFPGLTYADGRLVWRVKELLERGYDDGRQP